MEKWAHEELGIPLNEAASFFMRIRTPRLDLTKTAEVVKTALAEKSDEELKEEGRKRAVTGLAAEAERERGRRGSRLGKAVGSVAGGVGGAALGKKLIGGKAGAIAGLAAGMVAGGRAGEEVGTERDIKHNSPKFKPINKLGEAAPPEAYGPMSEMAHQAIMQRQGAAGRGGAMLGGLAGGLGGSLAQGLIGGPTGAASLVVPAVTALGAGLVARHAARKGVENKAEAVRNALLQRGHLQEILSQQAEAPSELAPKLASMRMQLALLKFADDGSMMAPTGEQGQGAMTPPPPGGELAPVNYLQAEMMGQQAQEAQEQSFYRDQLKGQQQQNEQLNQQVQQMQQQLQQVQQQADQASQQIQQSTQQAVAAQDQATQQAQEAASARISAQRMRAQILDLVSKDPSMFSIEQGQPGPGQGPPVDSNGQPIPPEAQGPDAGMGAPAQEGPAAGAPAPNTAPGAEPPAAAPDMNAPAGPPPGPNPAGAEGTTGRGDVEGQTDKTSADWGFYQMLAEGMSHRPFDGALTGHGEGKTASIMTHLPLIGAGLGAAGGAAGSLMAGRNVEGLQQRVQELEGTQNGGFRQALALASARKALAGAQLAHAHPLGSAAVGAAGGALTGSVVLPSMVTSGRGIVKKLKDRFGS